MEAAVALLFTTMILARVAWEVLKHGPRNDTTPKLPPPRRIAAHNAKKLIQNWHLMEDEGAGKKIAIRLDSGPAISTNAGLYWHFLRGEKDAIGLTDRFVKRGLSTDHLALAKKDHAMLYFKDKARLFYALNVLEQQMEWRHLGLLPDYIHSIKKVESFGENYHDDIVELNRAIWNTLLDMGKRLISDREALYCTRHLRRFIKQNVQEINMAVCPVCEKVIDSVKVDSVIACLDRTSSWTTRYDEDTCRVNVFKSDTFFDFEEVEIGPCTSDDIDAFCIEAGNDPSMSPNLDKVTIRLLPGIELEDRAKRNLQKVFGGRYNV